MESDKTYVPGLLDLQGHVYQLCVDTRCRLEDQLSVKHHRDGWREIETETENSMLSERIDDEYDCYIDR